MGQAFKLYLPATRVTHWTGPTSFNLRFAQIKTSALINGGIMSKIWNLSSWRLRYTSLGEPNTPEQLEELQRELPIQQPIFTGADDTLTYTWIGHSTAVININNKLNVLIDPVFLDRCSPVQIAGPKRFRRPACKLDELPRIDVVLVSHDHYDHLEESALVFLYQKWNPLFVAGIGSSDVFPRGSRLKQLDWTESFTETINGQRFTTHFVPACHWSRRGLMECNTRLWGGFVVETDQGQRMYYAGDTGYCEVFKEIGSAFDGFDLAIIPIGAYEPREYLKEQHVNPEEAVFIHKDLKAKKSVGVHWGTFPLGFEHFTQARNDLVKAVQKHSLKEDQFITIHHGANLTVSSKKDKP